MVSYIKYYFISPLLFFFLHMAKKSIGYNSIMDDLHSYNRRWQKTYSLGFLLYKDVFYRNVFYHRTQDVKPIKVLKWFLRPYPSFCIPNSLIIGGGIILSHPTSTYLNAKSIGRNFAVRQNTTIGNKIDGRNDLVPIIGDNVFVGANVCIIGNVEIGNNVIIGAGCVITKSVPSNTVVVGNPMRILKSNKDGRE